MNSTWICTKGRRRIPITSPDHHRDRGFTRLDLLAGLATVAMLSLVCLPLLGNPARSQRAVCANNLRQIAHGFQAYTMNHDNLYPWQINPNDFNYNHFRSAGPALGTTAILVCPSDTRSAASAFSNVTSANVSYFLNKLAKPNQRANWLAGDRNISQSSNVTNSANLRWNARINHGDEGNIVLVNGAVQQLTKTGIWSSADAVLSNQCSIQLILP
jgi:hypothetical protein